MKKGRTLALNADEVRELLDSIKMVRKTADQEGVEAEELALVGLRDRALIGVMVYTFARINAVLQMKVRDYFVQGRRGWVRPHEKGGKEHEVPGHLSLANYVDEYIAAAGIAGDPDAPLFQMEAGETTMLTGITAYMKNKGTPETAQHIVNHKSPRTTKLYDRRQDEISLDEVERIAI